MLLIEIIRPNVRLLFESEWRDRLWVHFSNVPQMTINAKGFHQDPAGIYFFPADHIPDYAIWHEKKFKFTARLTPNAQVLYLPDIGDDEMQRLVDMTGATQRLNDYWTQYPPSDRKKRIDMAWEMMRMTYMRSVPAAWNKAIRQLGYDAIYDDQGIIHSAEPQQLMVLNPRAIKIVSMEVQKHPIFASMQKVVKDIAEIGSRFGHVEIETPRRVNRYGEISLVARVQVEASESNYASFVISHDFKRPLIHAYLRFARPSLGYGVGATFIVPTQAYQKFSGLDEIDRALARIFASEQAATAKN